ncbi:serine/threonine-protein kinase [Cellulomonas soli]|uniref:non-specific serine/threonine protein kinase n=1 Tax=Cellulomonas soli TaxID=931535 RepID=A0A512PF40_9CELL|nr:serine/threonine-protein kinase [Cellulomonas soli]NYI59415.1 serine/threonine-protein kinase [Cellulomonas soli]GEP69793.1 hypothetical protein CSO01_25080 [Cellulomonas soli]
MTEPDPRPAGTDTDGLLLGRYRLGALLGSGRTADVHRAEDVRLRRPVAVKVHRAPSAAGEDPFEAARRLAALDDPHLVRVLDLGHDAQGRACVVLGLVDGDTLGQVLTAGRMPPADALALADAVLAGLGHAHTHGLLHLDVSPANVMVPRGAGPAGAVVLDLAGTPDPSGDATHVTVSPAYAAPELATAEGADARADLYAVGALLVHALTGSPPYPSEDPAVMLAGHVHEPVPVPSGRVPGLPREVDALVARALAKHPDDRFVDAAQMRRAVQAVAGTTRRSAPVEAAREVVDRAPVAAVVAPSARRPDEAGTPRLPVVERQGAPEPPMLVREGAGPARVLTLAAVLLLGGLAAGAALTAPDESPATVASTRAPTLTATTTAPAAPVEPPPASGPTPTGPTPSAAVRVPETVGLPLAAARDAVLAAGMVVGDILVVDGPSPADTVLGSTPDGASDAPPGTVVGLVVASGYTAVPDVVGRRWADVGPALLAAGFAVTEQGAAGAGVAADRVVHRIEPTAGARVPVGTTVVVVTGTAGSSTAAPTGTPAATGAPAGPTPTPTSTPTPAGTVP